MSAYIIARIRVTDPTQYEEYKKLSPGAVAAFGGEFIVRGGESETLEGSEETHRLVVVRFESMEKARAFLPLRPVPGGEGAARGCGGSAIRARRRSLSSGPGRLPVQASATAESLPAHPRAPQRIRP